MELGIFVAPQQGATYLDQLRVALAAERAGFGAFVRSDHYLTNADTISPPGPTDAWITLAGLARETTSILLGTLVSPVTFRLPGPLAVAVAQVDVMSGGRAMLGLGAAWHGREHAAYGIDFPEQRERFERLEEQLAIIVGMWTTPADERFTFSGRHYELVDVPALPRPVQQPHPTVIVGGTGPTRTPALAARYATEFNVPPMNTPAAAAALIGRVREACIDHGRDPDELTFSVTATTFCGATPEELEARFLRSPEQRQIADVSGSPDQVVEQLRAFRDAGAARVYLRLPDLHDIDHVELLGATVLPQLI